MTMRMTRPIVCALACVFVLGASGLVPAQGPTPGVDDGAALLVECGSALRAADGGAVLEENPVERGVHMGQCLGLVSAVWHTHKLLVDAFDSRQAFCPTAILSAGQMARLVHTYLTVHSDELDRWDTQLILEAYADTYPCRTR
jgi:hypothetical protein